jgi:hypothetical protein
MSEILPSATTAALIEQRIEALDLPMLASASNMMTGGSLRAEDVRKVLQMAAECALRTPNLEVIVAGLRAHYAGRDLTLGLAGTITTILI